jgi:RNA polymerase sigma-70 factor, ECF subfamily
LTELRRYRHPLGVVDCPVLAESPTFRSGTSATHPGLDQLGAIYQEHFEIIWRGLRRLGVPVSSLDDATQDVFLVVHRRLHEFEAKSTLRSWIFGIAVHVARYYRRSAARAAHQEAAETLVDDHASDPSQQAEDQQALRLVYATLDRLSDAHREVFVLCEVEEMTAPEVARLLKIPLNTVYSRLRHARAQFESMLDRSQKEPWRMR